MPNLLVIVKERVLDIFAERFCDGLFSEGLSVEV